MNNLIKKDKYHILFSDISDRGNFDQYNVRLTEQINNNIFKQYILIFGDNKYPDVTKSISINELNIGDKFYYNTYSGNIISGRAVVEVISTNTLNIKTISGSASGDILTRIIGYTY